MDFKDDLQKATFSCGKFWGMQFYFDQVPGVIDSRVGFTGGQEENPSPESVLADGRGHTEAVELLYDASLVNYDTLLKHFFRIHDPTKLAGAGKDAGGTFRSVIYYHSEDQKIVAEIILEELAQHYNKPIITKLVPAATFYPAPEADQKYTQKTGNGMHHLPYEQV